MRELKKQDKWIPIETAIHERIIKPTQFISYTPQKKTSILKAQNTGMDQEQSFTTECNLGWHPFIFNGQIYLIADEPGTNAELWLHGVDGYLRGESSIRICSEMYGDPEFKAKGVSITEEIFKGMPKEFKATENPYWIGTEFFGDTGDSEYGFLYAFGNQLHKKKLFDDTGKEYHNACYIRPLVLLPKDIKVRIPRNQIMHTGMAKNQGILIETFH